MRRALHQRALGFLKETVHQDIPKEGGLQHLVARLGKKAGSAAFDTKGTKLKVMLDRPGGANVNLRSGTQPRRVDRRGTDPSRNCT